METVHIWLIINLLVLFLGTACIGLSIYTKHVISSLFFWAGISIIGLATIAETVAVSFLIFK